MATAAATAASSSSQRIIHTYRAMVRMIQQLPESQATTFRKELRTKFRVPLSNDEDSVNNNNNNLEDRLREAGEKIAFLRIVTPKKGRAANGEGSGRWVYRDGKRVQDGDATSTVGKRVINGFQGHNLDPCLVKRHNVGLKRAGFQNNLHAKGIF